MAGRWTWNCHTCRICARFTDLRGWFFVSKTKAGSFPTLPIAFSTYARLDQHLHHQPYLQAQSEVEGK